MPRGRGVRRRNIAAAGPRQQGAAGRNRNARRAHNVNNADVNPVNDDVVAGQRLVDSHCQTDSPPSPNPVVTARGQKRTSEDLDGASNSLLQPDADAWILGDSIPYWAGIRAEATGKPNLRLPGKTIAWWAVRGLHWFSFRRTIEAAVLLSSPPKAIIIHLGGNDLTSLSIFQIKNLINREVKYLRTAFPAATIIWINILQKRVWDGAVNPWRTIENKRTRVNRWGRYLVRSSGKHDIVSPDIDSATNFWRQDGVHLNNVGLEFYLDYIRDVLDKNLKQ
ncbi:uncharacterized protein LOC123559617 [Mercenaria mercenaria]|uniref:uncharacterized protein LOC123559617 n=1 Tax=Mercenaria mercenaria TaxID=6596 RepID=UPI001E1DA646|nr:uncharacterized protein LOC123559617 [Mercenaria mercenaria]